MIAPSRKPSKKRPIIVYSIVLVLVFSVSYGTVSAILQFQDVQRQIETLTQENADLKANQAQLFITANIHNQTLTELLANSQYTLHRCVFLDPENKAIFDSTINEAGQLVFLTLGIGLRDNGTLYYYFQPVSCPI